MQGSARWLRNALQSLSAVGLAVGTLAFAASLTPSLIPRSYLMQGLLAGICLALGYGIGVGLRWLWRYMEIPEPQARLRAVVNAVVAAFCLAVAVLFLARAAEWQNSIRAAMEMPPVDSAHPVKLCAVALVTFALLLIGSRLFAALVGRIARLSRRHVPRRVANVAGLGIALVLVWSLTDNLLVRNVFHLLDLSYSRYDALIEPERPRPAGEGRTGGPGSLVRWEELGRAGREFIADGPDAAAIGSFTGRPARDPIRVYVGLGGAPDAAARARLAADELDRLGGFARSALIVVTPTGTGWIDPAAMEAAEYLLHGDVASVAVQYSYLSSPLSLLAQPEYGAEAAQALFREIYARWTRLPHDTRPRLYLHGLSLGAMNSERSAGLFEILGDPIGGALWSGPPFPSAMWGSLEEARLESTPLRWPVFGDSAVVRFMNQQGQAVPPDTPWGAMRVVYLQYASDPIVFFDYRDAWRRPDWMTEPRGEDVSPLLDWYPLVTMLQIGLDMLFATDVPAGYGHVYAAPDYVAAWSAVLDARDWPPEAIAALQQHLAARSAARDDGRGG